MSNSCTTNDDFGYGNYRDGNPGAPGSVVVLYKNNLPQNSESELYHANSTTSGDNNSAYDGLNRLTAFKRGTLSASGNNGSTLDTVSSASQSQSWSLNAVGDQSSVTTGNTTTTNTTNAKNELTANGSNSLTYDNNGNTLTDESGQRYTYDAWNREVTVKNSGNTTIATFSYDPTSRRITETSGNTTTDVYFSNQWQPIEERQGGSVTRQNVWGEGYVNQLVERDDNSTSGSLGKTSSGLGRRLYAQQDANWNVTSLVNTSGAVVERMTYLPYGAVTFLTTSWGSTSDAYAQNVLFQGGRLETATGQYIFDCRDYDPTSGSWKEQDPLGYVDGQDRYECVGDTPIVAIDPTGTRKITFAFDAFINGRLGTWLNEPDTLGAGGLLPNFVQSDQAQFLTNMRGFGAFNFSFANANAKIFSLGFIDSDRIGKISEHAVSGNLQTGVIAVMNGAGFSQQRTRTRFFGYYTAWGAPARKKTTVNSGVHVYSTPATAIDPLASTTILIANSGNYPFQTISPDIDYDVRLEFKKCKVSNLVDITMNTTHDSFPDYEAYIDQSLFYMSEAADNGPSIYNLNDHSIWDSAKWRVSV